MKRLDPELRRLVAHLDVVRKQAKALGLFTNERELLECPGCGLMEDVTADGILITCREPDLGKDTGLRFAALNQHAFRCPACGRSVREPLPETGSEEAPPA